ncbi:uncharacterized protein DUF3159 [Nocardioides albertanoniae]|uniref:Uncharacterized protein DUF3159 n=1 Tax=Nocardioides albertanoniae TaxID=1175486 RepID=A0A543A702_9ACTN|nr:DUF3159 domain-containing protein [Nocardioides albertanoniae]TQL68374.1 uncharacterized protein DUF3159 [Nocardioides albertanoniae]
MSAASENPASEGPAAEGDQAPHDQTPHDRNHPSVDTVEAVVRRQMSAGLGGVRGMAEAGVPGLVFTIAWLVTKDLKVALIASAATAVLFLVARLVQRSTMQYVGNAIFGILIGFAVVRLTQSMGGSAEEQALAYFLPGILISIGYTVVVGGLCLIGWPIFGFFIGVASGDPLAWHQDKQIVRLCSRLTWLFLAPGAIGAAIQGPIWFLAWSGAIDRDWAILALGILRTAVGWALRIACYGTMIWLLARNHTPVERPQDA